MFKNDGREQITIQDIREWAKSGVGRSLAEIDLNKISRNIKDDSIKVGAKNIVTKSRVYTIVTERFYHGSYLSKVEYEDYNGTEVELADIVLSPPFDSASLSVLGNSALETFILYCSLVMNLNTNLWVSSQEAFFTSVEEAINATNAAKTHSPNSPANSTMTVSQP